MFTEPRTMKKKNFMLVTKTSTTYTKCFPNWRSPGVRRHSDSASKRSILKQEQMSSPNQTLPSSESYQGVSESIQPDKNNVSEKDPVKNVLNIKSNSNYPVHFPENKGCNEAPDDWTVEYGSFCADLLLRDPELSEEYRKKLVLVKSFQNQLARIRQRTAELIAEAEQLKYERQAVEFQTEVQNKKNQQLAEENSECMVRVSENRCLEENIRRLKHQLTSLSEQAAASREERRQIRAECVRTDLERQRLADECLRLESNRAYNRSQLEELHRRREELELYQEDVTHRQELASRWQEVAGAILVFVRIRTCQQTDLKQLKYIPQGRLLETGCLIMPTDEKLGILSPRDSAYLEGARFYQFSKIFAPYTSQCRVYQGLCNQVRRVVEGHNVTIIFHGASGSGKTYTVCGTKEEPGVAFFAVADLLRLTKEKGPHRLSIYVSAIEIYNEHVTCILSRRSVRVKDTGSVVHIENQQEKLITEISEFSDVLVQICNDRKHSMTGDSQTSSRSHLIIITKLVKAYGTNSCNHIGTLILVDLAGTMRTSTDERMGRNRQIKQENWHIQRSIIMLSSVIHQLRKQDIIATCRGSRLTELLKPCFSGDSYLTLFLTITDDPASSQVTQNVLELGRSAMGTVLGQPNNHSSQPRV
ncbi:unnamed protein product [Calicophoron daubneyi]|uniref:Kinesin motor domain-containing protein n=1 Tax=Calicophoron daubneyi TaxID=300641 RepID=A0AAV2TZC2_CALDB